MHYYIKSNLNSLQNFLIVIRVKLNERMCLISITEVTMEYKRMHKTLGTDITIKSRVIRRENIVTLM